MSYLFSVEMFITLCKIKVNFFHSFVICAGNVFSVYLLLKAIENQSDCYGKNNRQTRIYVKKSPFAILFFDECHRCYQWKNLLPAYLLYYFCAPK
jgi:hypothetical protein